MTSRACQAFGRVFQLLGVARLLPIGKGRHPARCDEAGMIRAWVEDRDPGSTNPIFGALSRRIPEVNTSPPASSPTRFIHSSRALRLAFSTCSGDMRAASRIFPSTAQSESVRLYSRVARRRLSHDHSSPSCSNTTTGTITDTRSKALPWRRTRLSETMMIRSHTICEPSGPVPTGLEPMSTSTLRSKNGRSPLLSEPVYRPTVLGFEIVPLAGGGVAQTDVAKLYRPGGDEPQLIVLRGSFGGFGGWMRRAAIRLL